MLTQQDLEKSPLFQDISYEEYSRMLTCFQAVRKSFRSDDMVYDFSSPLNDAVGIIERGEAALIRIDEEGVSTVMEELRPGGVFGRMLAFAGSGHDSLEVSAGRPVACCLLIMLISSSGVKMPAPTTACWCRTCSS